MWLPPLPDAVVPLWQLAQVPVTLAWLKLAGVQPPVWWQSLHSPLVGTCDAGLPVAVVPLWQLVQEPSTSP